MLHVRIVGKEWNLRTISNFLGHVVGGQTETHQSHQRDQQRRHYEVERIVECTALKLTNKNTERNFLMENSGSEL